MGNPSFEQTVTILHQRVLPYCSKAELIPFAKILMLKARLSYETKQDIALANKIWEAVFALDISPEQNQAVILTMMSTANKSLDGALPKEQREIDGGIETWRTAYRIGTATEKEIVLKTMMKRAKDLLTHDIGTSLKLWRTAYDIGPAQDKERIYATIMDIAGKTSGFPLQAINALEQLPATPYFKVRITASLYYQAGDFARVIEYVNLSGRLEPEITGQKAEALRKLRQYPEAIDFSTNIIELLVKRGTRTFTESAALAQAFCCRGYCYLELAKKGANEPGLVEFAIGNFRSSIMLAERDNCPVPPRAYTGLGYVYESTKQIELARQAFARTLQIDPDNSKARKKLSQLT